TVHVYNPPNGWIQNCNSTPFTVSGPNSPKRSDYPSYMAPDGENFRGVNAVRVLERGNAYTLESLIKAGYDNFLAAFEKLVPALVNAYEKETAQGDHSYDSLAAPIALLKQWDFRCSTQSVASCLALEWGQRILPQMSKYYEQSQNDQVLATDLFIGRVAPVELLKPLQEVIFQLKKSFGRWEVALGEINRYQRLNGHIDSEFDDQSPSLPVGRVSSTWGCIPSFVSRYFPGTKLRYGYNGNSFICAVEFGEKVKAKSLLTGGESGHPDSKHFSDQASMYVDGQFKDVLFYKDDVLAHAEKKYHPGK
ncbi:MAG: penicillin acylase family protein, partial [Chitinophagales bacterium]